MMVNDQDEFDQVSGVCWLATGEAEALAMWVYSASLVGWSLIRRHRQGFPQAMPFSQTYPMCCINIRNFVDQFYQFTDGVAQQHLDIDEVLRKVSRDADVESYTEVSRSLWTAYSPNTSARRLSRDCRACPICHKLLRSWSTSSTSVLLVRSSSLS